jgi:transcriptional regulator with XRE-family HTH domain
MRKRTINPSKGRRLAELRVSRGLSQRMLAETIGASTRTVQNYESARTALTADRLEQLAHALQCRCADLLDPPGT